MQDKNILILIAGFISAIFISSFFKLGFSLSVLFIFISTVILFYRGFLSEDEKGVVALLLVGLFFFGFGLGILRYEIKDLPNSDIDLESLVNQKVIIEGVITEEPKEKENYTQFILDFKNLIERESLLKISGKGMVKTDFFKEFDYGDLIRVSGKLELPQNITEDDGREFDYISYLEKDGVKYELNFVKAEILSKNHGNPAKSLLFKIKNSFTKNIEAGIPEPQSSLLGGILLGARSSMSKELSDNFKKVGLSHIVALSGYNITIVAESIMNFLSFLPRNISFLSGFLGILLFVIMSGSSATAVRAAIMSLIVILASFTNRKYFVGRALIFAGVVMLVYNPEILIFDISFQLSFLATVAIIYVSPILEKNLSFVTEKLGMRKVIASTISAQVLVLPLIIYKMGIISLVALPVNILVLMVIPLVMFFGFLTGMFGFLSIFISLPFAWVSWFLLSYMIEVSNFFVSLPFSSVTVSSINFSWVLLSYFILFVIFYFLNLKVKERIIKK